MPLHQFDLPSGIPGHQELHGEGHEVEGGGPGFIYMYCVSNDAFGLWLQAVDNTWDFTSENGIT